MVKLTKVSATITSGEGAGSISSDYLFLAPKGLYTGAIAIATGITQLADNSNDRDEPIYSVGELIKARKIVRISVRTQEGTTIRTVKMFCLKTKLGTVDEVANGLIDKIISMDGALVSGSKIVSVVGKRSASFY